jgi:hypothetical protein
LLEGEQSWRRVRVADPHGKLLEAAVAHKGAQVAEDGNVEGDVAGLAIHSDPRMGCEERVSQWVKITKSCTGLATINEALGQYY